MSKYDLKAYACLLTLILVCFKMGGTAMSWLTVFAPIIIITLPALLFTLVFGMLGLVLLLAAIISECF